MEFQRTPREYIFHCQLAEATATDLPTFVYRSYHWVLGILITVVSNNIPIKYRTF
jgi:hypothetical protein